jgi:hypothetical protein
MYVCPVDRHGIVSYLHGYEAGTKGECGFTALLRKKLEQKYDIKHEACGWPDQVSRYAESRELDWLQAFLFLASEVVNEHINLSQK